MRTDENLKALADKLQQNCGDLYDACKSVGVSVGFLTKWMADDPEACKILEEAQRVGWMGLESVAIKRAVVGEEKGVYFKGEKIGTEKVTSDALLSKIMEARIPAYQKKSDAGGGATFNGPTQINMMPRAENFEEWLAMKDATLERRAQAALPAPVKVPEILQGDFVEVPSPMSVLKGLL